MCFINDLSPGFWSNLKEREKREITPLELFHDIYSNLDATYIINYDLVDKPAPNEFIQFLSDMNPELGKDGKSADPAIYADYEKFIGNRKIYWNKRYDVAKEYIDHLNNPIVSKMFYSSPKERWYTVYVPS